MAWQAPILAHVDRLGRMFCVECEPDLESDPVYGDQYFGADDCCERCSKQLEHVPTSRYVRAS